MTLEKVRLEEEEDEPSTKAPSKGDESTLATVTKDGSASKGDGTGDNRKHQILRSSSSSSSGTKEKMGKNEAAGDRLTSSGRGRTSGDDTIGASKARASSFSDPRSAKRRCADPVDESLDLDKVKLSESGAIDVGTTPNDANKKKRTTAASKIEGRDKSAKTPEGGANKKRPAIAEKRELDRKKRPATSGATSGDDATVVDIDKGLIDADPAPKKTKCASVVEDEDDDTSLDLGKVRLDDENPPTSTGRGRGSDDEGEAPSRKKKRKESHGGHNDEEKAYKEAISATDEGPEDDNGDAAAAAATAEEEEEGVRDGDDNSNDVASGNNSTPDAEDESGSEDKCSPNESDDGGRADGETIDGPIKSKKVKHELTQEEEGVQDDEIDLESKAYRKAITSADEADDEAVEPNDAEKKDN